jgi:hypothetical protein
MAAKKKQTKAEKDKLHRARRRQLDAIAMKGIKKARKPVDRLIKPLKVAEVAVSVAGLLGPGGVVAGGGKKIAGHIAKRAAERLAKRGNVTRLTGESTRTRSLEQLRQPFRGAPKGSGVRSTVKPKATKSKPKPKAKSKPKGTWNDPDLAQMVKEINRKRSLPKKID